MIEKVSEITYTNIANYIRLDVTTQEEQHELQTYLKIAKEYISSYSGIPIASTDESVKTLDDYPDFIIAIYVLCQDMYDNRSLYVDAKNVNKVVQTILDLHSTNNL